MQAPQIIIICLSAMALGITLAKNGEPEGNYCFGSTLFATVINISILYWGGFFG